MSQKDRLGTGGRINRAIPLTFTFNGRTYQGFQGDTLARPRSRTACTSSRAASSTTVRAGS